MRRTVTFILAALTVALTFSGGQAHVGAKHAYFGAFTVVGVPPAPAVFFGQDLTANEGGHVIGIGTTVKLSCFALFKTVGQTHHFKAFGRTNQDGSRLGFLIVDNAVAADTLTIYRDAVVTNRKTCTFAHSGIINKAVGAGAAVGPPSKRWRPAPGSAAAPCPG